MRKKVGKFLILSESGSGLGLAVRLKAEGHEVKMKIFDSDYEGLGHGLVDCACEYSFGETVVADCVGFGHVLDSFRDAGIRTFGGGVYADKLESDRQLAEEVMQEAGIEVPQSVRVTSWDEAAKAVKKLAELGGKVALKPEGTSSGLVPSRVAADAEEGLEILKQFERKFGTSEVNLTIQEFIKGIAFSTEGWFNGEAWVPGMFNHTIERKQFLCGDLGPSTGCTGNLVWACDENDPVVKQTLTKLTEALAERRYVGAIDINTVVNKKGIYALEFTPRFGYDAFPTLLGTLCDFNFGAFIDELAGGSSSGVELSPGFGAGVRIGLPPWPSEGTHGEAGIKIRGLEERDKQWFYPYEVALLDDGLQSSKGFGILGVVNGHGDCVGEAFAQAYERVARLKVPDLQYRQDLGKACFTDFVKLRSLLGNDEVEGWIGVDLDGTLATYGQYSGEIGEPIPKMVQRIKRWLREGKDVRILTARGSVDDDKHPRYEQLCRIYDWSREHIGEALEITCEKDPSMIRLYDDRVVKVEANEGTLA